MSPGTEEAVKDALNIIDMLFFDIAASFEVITEHRRARAAHHAQLLAQIRLSAATVPAALAAFERAPQRLRQGYRVGFGQRCRRPEPVVRQDRRASDLVVRPAWVSVQARRQ